VDYYAAYAIVVFPHLRSRLSPFYKKTGKISRETALTSVNGDQLKVLKLG
jgi:hypothetical protein